MAVTQAVTAVEDAAPVDNETITLQPEMLLECSKCNRWHEVREDKDATGSAVGMMFWTCDGAKFFAGHRGHVSRHQVKRTRLTSEIDSK